MARLPRGYVTLGDAIALASQALADGGPAADGRLDAGRAVLRQLLIGGAVEAIVTPRRRKACAIPTALWSTDYAATMFDAGAAKFADGIGMSEGTVEGPVALPRRALAAALKERARRAAGAKPAGRAEILAAFERLCAEGLVSFGRGGLARAADTLAWSFPGYKAASIASIVRSAYAARRDAQVGAASSRPLKKARAPR